MSNSVNKKDLFEYANKLPGGPHRKKEVEPSPCDHCHGFGYMPDLELCDNCDGEGEIFE